MPKRWSNRALTAKIESTYGVDAIPTGGANAMLCAELELDIPVEYVDRNIVHGTFGAWSMPGTRRFAKVTGSVELQGSGTAGSAPAWAPMLRACGFAQTLNAGVSAVYTPTSAVGDSVTLRFYADGVLHAISGARGTGQLLLPRNRLPLFKFEMTGLYSQPTDTANPSMDYSVFQAPRPVDKANTPTFSLHGSAAVLRDLELDIGNVIAVRDLPNAMDVLVADRKCSGKCSVEAVAVATKNWFGIEQGETLGALSLIHGSTAGKIVEIAAPKVQLKSPKYENEDGIAYITMELGVTRNSGDDELVLTVR